jgi:hypothetical protein
VQLKVICGTSSYDYGTLTYVEEMFLSQLLHTLKYHNRSY